MIQTVIPGHAGTLLVLYLGRALQFISLGETIMYAGIMYAGMQASCMQAIRVFRVSF